MVTRENVVVVLNRKRFIQVDSFRQNIDVVICAELQPKLVLNGLVPQSGDELLKCKLISVFLIQLRMCCLCELLDCGEELVDALVR